MPFPEASPPLRKEGGCALLSSHRQEGTEAAAGKKRAARLADNLSVVRSVEPIRGRAH